MLDLCAVPRHSEAVIYRILRGEAVLLSLDNSYYYSLDPIGSEIWGMCDGTHSVQSLLDWMCAEYDVARDRAQRDLLELIGDLQQEELITFDGSAEEPRPAAG